MQRRKDFAALLTFCDQLRENGAETEHEDWNFVFRTAKLAEILASHGWFARNHVGFTEQLLEKSDHSVCQLGIVIESGCNIITQSHARQLVLRQPGGDSLSSDYALDTIQKLLANFVAVRSYCQLELHVIRDDVVFRAAVD